MTMTSSPPRRVRRSRPGACCHRRRPTSLVAGRQTRPPPLDRVLHAPSPQVLLPPERAVRTRVRRWLALRRRHLDHLRRCEDPLDQLLRWLRRHISLIPYTCPATALLRIGRLASQCTWLNVGLQDTTERFRSLTLDYDENGDDFVIVVGFDQVAVQLLRHLGEIEAPTLVIHAGEDIITGPRTTKPLEEGLRNSVGVTMDDVAHVVAGKEEKIAFGKILFDFLGAH